MLGGLNAKCGSTSSKSICPKIRTYWEADESEQAIHRTTNLCVRSFDCMGMITPGFAFALAAEIFQEGKESAQKLAIETAEDIEGKLSELEAENG